MVHPLQIKIHSSEGDDDHPLDAKIDDRPNPIRSSSEINQRKVVIGSDDDDELSTWKKIKGCWGRSETVIRIFSYLRLVLAMTLYFLIAVDVIHLTRGKGKSFWVEVFTQLINAEFTLLTLISHPKRIRNLPRAIKIFSAGGGGNIAGAQGVSEDVRKTQLKVHKDYDWYTYEGEQMFICTPEKLLLIMLLWNLGSIAQYGVASILWFSKPLNRPIVAYIVVGAVSFLCEFLPIPMVVMQTRLSRNAKKFSEMDRRSGALATQRNMRSLEMKGTL
ncbi:hypothetical protein G9A89_009623 [Geosiphon pyriformis]|nr:hypothetical protein G9A89_009623 [Geosiphon pyriformis]